MAKQPELVEIEAAAAFKLADKDVRIGDRLTLPVNKAIELIAVGFAIKPPPYRDRAMRSSER